MFKWLSGGEAAEVDTALADNFVLETTSGAGARRSAKRGEQGPDPEKLQQRFLQRVYRETRPLKLNIFRRASLANSFKFSCSSSVSRRTWSSS